jgi:hypothetical protein
MNLRRIKLPVTMGKVQNSVFMTVLLAIFNMSTYCNCVSQTRHLADSDSCFVKNLLAVRGYGSPYIILRVAIEAEEHEKMDGYLIMENDALSNLLISIQPELKDLDLYNGKIKKHLAENQTLILPRSTRSIVKHHFVPLDTSIGKVTFEVRKLYNEQYQCYQTNGFAMSPNDDTNVFILHEFYKRNLIFRNQETAGYYISSFDCEGNCFFVLKAQK